MPGKRKPQAPRRKGSPRAKSQPISASNKARLVPASQLPERSFSARERSQHAVADMRHGASPSQAARDNGVTLRTIKKYLGSALLQERPGGRIRVTKSDRSVRYLQLPGLHGPIDLDAHGSRQASDAARYMAALNRFFRGDLKALEPWHKKKIAGIELITDPNTLKGLAQDELLPYSLYRSLSGGSA